MSSYFTPTPLDTTKVSVVRPALAAPVIVSTAAGAFTYGAYADLAAANDLAAHDLIGLLLISAASRVFFVQIGTGGGPTGAGELVLAVETDVGYALPLMLPIPIQIPVNARVAARVACNVAGVVTTQIAGIFLPR